MKSFLFSLRKQNSSNRILMLIFLEYTCIYIISIIYIYLIRNDSLKFFLASSYSKPGAFRSTAQVSTPWPKNDSYRCLLTSVKLRCTAGQWNNRQQNKTSAGRTLAGTCCQKTDEMMWESWGSWVKISAIRCTLTFISYSHNPFWPFFSCWS